MNTSISDMADAIEDMIPDGNPGDLVGVKILKTGEPLVKLHSDGIKYSKRYCKNGGNFQTLLLPEGVTLPKENTDAIEASSNASLPAATSGTPVWFKVLVYGLKVLPYVLTGMQIYRQAMTIKELNETLAVLQDKNQTGKNDDILTSENQDEATYDTEENGYDMEEIGYDMEELEKNGYDNPNIISFEEHRKDA